MAGALTSAKARQLALTGLTLSPTIPPKYKVADEAPTERGGGEGADGGSPPETSRSSLRKILARMRGGFSDVAVVIPPPPGDIDAVKQPPPIDNARLPLTERKESGLRALEALRELLTGARGGKPLLPRSTSARSRFPKRDVAHGFTANPYASGQAQPQASAGPPAVGGAGPQDGAPPQRLSPGSRSSSNPSVLVGGAAWTDDLEFVYDLLRSEELHHVLAVADASWDSNEDMRSKLASKDLRDYFRAIFSPDAMPAEEQLERQANDGEDSPTGGSTLPRAAADDGASPARSGDVEQRLRAPSRPSLGGVARPNRERRPGSGSSARRAARRSLADEDTSTLPALYASISSADDAKLLRWSAQIAAGDEDLSVFELGKAVADPLTFIAMVTFSRHKLNEAFGIGFARMQLFCKALNQGYRDSNAFHNRFHAADVAYAMHMFVLHSGIVEQRALEPLHILALLFGALVHDFRHPGVTNTYLVASADPLALTYNDKSVLENYHAAEAFKLMQQAQYNLFRALDPKQQRELRSLVLRLILSTDMAEHFGQVTELVSTAPHPPSPKMLTKYPQVHARAREGELALCSWAGGRARRRRARAWPWRLPCLSAVRQRAAADPAPLVREHLCVRVFRP